MRYNFFLYYGWFLQNLRKYFIRTNMQDELYSFCAINQKLHKFKHPTCYLSTTWQQCHVKNQFPLYTLQMALFIKIHLGIALQACKSAAWCAACRTRPIKLVPMPYKVWLICYCVFPTSNLERLLSFMQLNL